MILLDTHIIVWLITMPECLSKSAMIAIEEDTRNGGRPAVSAATIFEIFYLKRDGRLQTSAPDEEMLRQLRRAVDVFRSRKPLPCGQHCLRTVFMATLWTD
jgi:PIN domain nuclease of toxin-antitoxin system